MSRARAKQPAPERTTVRCAIYTRKSTEEGLEQEFNSLDAQREAGEAYIKSQQHEGWICLDAKYDDGGFTGANMDRPALKRLLADIEAGLVDCVVVYKVDRLSRSLLDFARIMEAFDRKNISFVSVTQAFNTGSSMGRLVLNVLLSFAQFEREMISERTRDKIAAARRKGKWSGGMPLLGYNVVNTKLVVNELEADRVRQIFQLYRDCQSLLVVATELARRGWRTKEWTTGTGNRRGAMMFDKTRLYHMLTNVTYVGKIRYKQEVHPGEHQGIVDSQLFEQVQEILRRNGKTGGRIVRNKYNALLKGLMHCVTCGCAMSHGFASRKGGRYRYYICQRAQKRGWRECPCPSIPAIEIEQFVLARVREIGADERLVRETYRKVEEALAAKLAQLKRERADLQAKARECQGQLRWVAAQGEIPKSLAWEIEGRAGEVEKRLAEVMQELTAFEAKRMTEADVSGVLANFNAAWDNLLPRQQCRVLELLIERVEWDSKTERIGIVFRDTGVLALAEKLQHIAELSTS